MKSRVVASTVACMLLAWCAAGSDHIQGYQLLTGRIRFTVAETGQPLADAEIRYAVDRDRAQELIALPDSPAEKEVVFEYRTDLKGEATVTLIAHFSGFMPVEDDDPPARLYILPTGVLRARHADAWVDCEFPHMEQTSRIRLEWLETIDEPLQGEKRKAIKAVDPTPVGAPRDLEGSSEG